MAGDVNRLTRKQCERLVKDAKLPQSCRLPVLKEKKRKKWRVTDPQEIAPSYYHEDLFKANFPLVDVIKVEASRPFPVIDKFEGVTLDSAVTREPRSVWCERLIKVSRSYKLPGNEKQALAFHLAFLEELQPFTNPSERELERVRSSRAGRKRKWDGVDQDHLTGFAIEAEREDVEDPNSRNRGDLIEHEDIPTGFAHTVLRVHDSRPLKRARASDEAAGIQTERVALVLERKFAEDDTKDRAVWQGGYHCVKHAESNLEKGHGTPLYILVVTSHFWSYAILVPEAYVQLRNGSIDPACEAAFSKHQTFTAPEHKSDLATLGDKLTKGTEFYRRNYSDNPTATYRDGPQLVGKLYVRDAWFRLPNTEDYGFVHQGAKRLFDGLLRLVVGDSVLSMSGEELMRRVEVNREMERVLKESVLGD